MKRSIIFILSMFIAWTSYSQDQQLRGRVFNATDNSPVEGANVQVAGKTGTITDKDGKFSILCQPNMELVVSYVGYATYKQVIKNCSVELNIALQPKSSTLNEIEITASSNRDKALLQQPISIVKLGTPELKQNTGLYLKEAINTNVPGVFMESRTNSAGQQFNIRGYGNGVRGTNGVNSNFDGQGSKVYLNGIPITDAEGITVMDDIDFNSITNVEVSKGPSGTLYGQAIAGVVNLQTVKAPKNQASIGEDFMAGSYGLIRSTTHLAIGGEKSSILLNYGHQKYDGFMVHTAAHKDFVNFVGDITINDKQSLSTYFGYSDSYDERNGELTIEQWENKDYSGNPAYIKNNAHSAVKSFRAGLTYNYNFCRHVSNTTTLFGDSRKMNNSSAGGWTDKSPLDYGLRSTFNFHFKLSDKLNLGGIAGLELQRTDALANGYRMGTDSTNPDGYNLITQLRSVASTTSSTGSYFTQWTLDMPAGFSLTAGIGLSTMKLKLEDRLWGLNSNTPGNTTPQVYEATYNNMISPMVALNKKLGNNASVYISYSTGYKAPTTSYFYIPTTGEVNTGLKPEKGSQIEVGTKGSVLDNRLFYTLALFQAKFSDKMTAVTVQNPENTATLYSYIVNGGSLNNKGLEILAKYTAVESKHGFVSSFRPFANLAYSNFKYEDFKYEKAGTGSDNQDTTFVFDYSGNQVAGVPPVVFNLGADVNTHIGLYANVVFNYRGEMYFTSDEMNQTKAYSLLNAKLGYTKNFNHFSFDIYAGADNITGTQYYYMVFLNQLPDAYLPAPYKTTFYGGINLKYIF